MENKNEENENTLHEVLSQLMSCDARICKIIGKENYYDVKLETLIKRGGVPVQISYKMKYQKEDKNSPFEHLDYLKTTTHDYTNVNIIYFLNREVDSDEKDRLKKLSEGFNKGFILIDSTYKKSPNDKKGIKLGLHFGAATEENLSNLEETLFEFEKIVNSF